MGHTEYTDPSTTTLRRRMGFLREKPANIARSDISTESVASTSRSQTETYVDHEEDDTIHPPPIEQSESDTESTQERAYTPPEDSHSTSPPATPIPPSPMSRERRSQRNSSRPRPSSPSSGELPPQKAWYEFDLAVTVALISPLGNWLTGGDHIKNLLLVFLLLYYLHQIIERPWSLYLSSLPRRRPTPNPSDPDSEPDVNTKLALNELNGIEFFFLALTVVSPLVGAVLLKTVSSMLTGEDALSWFSTGMFVLATGIRPWTHLLERLSTRIEELHDVIHYPSSAEPTSSELKQEMDDLRAQLLEMEKSFAKFRQKMVNDKEEIYDHIEDQIDSVEKVIRRGEKKYEKQEAKVRDVEASVEKLVKGKNKAKIAALQLNLKTPPENHGILDYIFPTWLFNPPRRNSLLNVPNGSANAYSPQNGNFTNGANGSNGHLHPHTNGTSNGRSSLHSPNTSTVKSPYRSSSGLALETIPEEYGFPNPKITTSIKADSRGDSAHHKKSSTVSVSGNGRVGGTGKYSNPIYALVRTLLSVMFAPIVVVLRLLRVVT